MKKLRFAVALAGLALAWTPTFAMTEDPDERRCPIGLQYSQPKGTCAHTGIGSCANANCEYECENSEIIEYGCPNA